MRGRGKTKIVTTQKDGRGSKGEKSKKFAKSQTKKIRRTKKGYPMGHITKGQMTYKRKARKR